MPETKTETLTEFLLARIAEDEALARAAGPDGRPLGGHWVSRHHDQPDLHIYGEFGWVVEGADVETHDSEWGRSVADHIARHHPARVLAECEAKRRIVRLYLDTTHYEPNDPYDAALLDVMRFLALPYADHPDYRDEWRP